MDAKIYQAKGLKQQEIAEIMGVSVRTVRNYQKATPELGPAQFRPPVGAGHYGIRSGQHPFCFAIVANNKGSFKVCLVPMKSGPVGAGHYGIRSGQHPFCFAIVANNKNQLFTVFIRPKALDPKGRLRLGVVDFE